MGIAPLIGGLFADVGADVGAPLAFGAADAGAEAATATLPFDLGGDTLAATEGLQGGLTGGLTTGADVAGAGSWAAWDPAIAEGGSIFGEGGAGFGGDIFGSAAPDMGFADVGGPVDTFGGGDATLGSSGATNIGTFSPANAANVAGNTPGLSSADLTAQSDSFLANPENIPMGTPNNPAFGTNMTGDLSNAYGSAGQATGQGWDAAGPGINENLIGPNATSQVGVPTDQPFGAGAQNLTQGSFAPTTDPFANYPSADIGAYPGQEAGVLQGPGQSLTNLSGQPIASGQEFVQAGTTEPLVSGAPAASPTAATTAALTTPTAVATPASLTTAAPAAATGTGGLSTAATTTVPAAAAPAGTIPGSVAPATAAAAAPAAAPAAAGGFLPAGVRDALSVAGLGMAGMNVIRALNQPTPQQMMGYPPGYAGMPYGAGGYNAGMGYGTGFSTPLPNNPDPNATQRLANALVSGHGDALAQGNGGYLPTAQAAQLNATYNALVQDFANEHGVDAQSLSPSIKNIIAAEALGNAGQTSTGPVAHAA